MKHDANLVAIPEAPPQQPKAKRDIHPAATVHLVDILNENPARCGIPIEMLTDLPKSERMETSPKLMNRDTRSFS
jgi:hypothetical protein